MASVSLMHPVWPVHSAALYHGHSGKADTVPLCNANGSEDIHDINMEEDGDDDNIVHILASLESHRSFNRADNVGSPSQVDQGHHPALGEESGSEEEIDEWDEDDSDSYAYDRHPKRSSNQLPSFSSVRSFACEKHSKWKKKCPANCPLRKEHARVPMARRKLWTQKESALLVKWADDLVLADRETDVMWEDIAKTLNRSVNSTKKKFMRLTNQWSRKPAHPSSPTTSPSRPPTSPNLNYGPLCSVTSPNKEKRKRDTDEEVEEEYDSDEEEHYNEIRGERRATIVCEKHRRWKKRCPADCKDKREVQGAIQTIAGGKRKTRHRLVGVVGRPAVSCRRHQLEHQKCPEDCPRRRTVDQHLNDRDREKRKEDGRGCSRSLLHECSYTTPTSSFASVLPSSFPSGVHNDRMSSSNASQSLPLASNNAQHNIPQQSSRSRQLSSENSNEFQFYHNLIWKSPSENESLEPDFHWYRPRESTTVSNAGIILDLQDSGPPRVSIDRSRRNSYAGYGESELETRRAAVHLQANTFISVRDPLLSLSAPPSTPPLPLSRSWPPSPDHLPATQLSPSFLSHPEKLRTPTMQLPLFNQHSPLRSYALPHLQPRSPPRPYSNSPHFYLRPQSLLPLECISP